MYIQENESIKELLEVVSTFHDISHTSSVWRLNIFVRQLYVLFILYNVILHIGRCYRQTSHGRCTKYCQVKGLYLNEHYDCGWSICFR